MPYSLILDLLVAALLAVTIGFAVVLNKRLGKLRQDKKSLEKLAVTFGESTLRAEEGVETLKQTTEILQERLEKSQALKDDLAFLIERGDRTADNLENLIRATRDSAPGGPGARPEPDAPAAGKENPSPLTAMLNEAGDEADFGDDGEIKSEAERELLKAIRSAG